MVVQNMLMTVAIQLNTNTCLDSFASICHYHEFLPTCHLLEKKAFSLAMSRVDDPKLRSSPLNQECCRQSLALSRWLQGKCSQSQLIVMLCCHKITTVTWQVTWQLNLHKNTYLFSLTSSLLIRSFPSSDTPRKSLSGNVRRACLMLSLVRSMESTKNGGFPPSLGGKEMREQEEGEVRRRERMRQREGEADKTDSKLCIANTEQCTTNSSILTACR